MAVRIQAIGYPILNDQVLIGLLTTRTSLETDI